MVSNSIRPVAIALIRWNDTYMIFEGYDKIKDEYFYRPLGGGIEFGEYGHQTIKREILEEIGAKIYDIRYLYTLENIFICDGLPGHEIVQIYEAKLEDTALYGQEMDAVEDNGQIFHEFTGKPTPECKGQESSKGC